MFAAHVEKHIELKLFVCFVFLQEVNLKKHLETHSQCNSISFELKSNLEDRVMMHSNGKPH